METYIIWNIRILCVIPFCIQLLPDVDTGNGKMDICASKEKNEEPKNVFFLAKLEK